MPTKYTNAGQSGGAIVGTTITDADYIYSNTGSAVYSNNDEQHVVPISDLGFSGDVTDLCIRLDYRRCTDYRPSLRIKVYFDDNGATDYIGIGMTNLYYSEKGASSQIIANDLYGKAVNKIVLHVTTTSLKLCINDTVVADKTGINNGKKITSIVFLTQDMYSTTLAKNDMFSNIIIADYDCSSETLAEHTGPISVTNHYDFGRKQH